MSASSTSNSDCDISPSSTRICASSSCSRSLVSSLISVSTAAAILSKTNRRPPTSSESRMNIVNQQSAISHPNQSASRFVKCVLVGSFQPEPDVDEVVRRPRTGELERRLVVTLPDVLDPGVERLLEAAGDEKGSIHDHPVADRLVRSRRHRHVSQRLEDFG